MILIPYGERRCFYMVFLLISMPYGQSKKYKQRVFVRYSIKREKKIEYEKRLNNVTRKFCPLEY